MATHSSVLAWRFPGTGEPGGLPSMGSHRVGHDWSNLAAAAAGAKKKKKKPAHVYWRSNRSWYSFKEKVLKKFLPLVRHKPWCPSSFTWSIKRYYLIVLGSAYLLISSTGWDNVGNYRNYLLNPILFELFAKKMFPEPLSHPQIPMLSIPSAYLSLY